MQNHYNVYQNIAFLFLKAVTSADELKDTHDISIAENNQQTFPGKSRFYFLLGCQKLNFKKSKFKPVSSLDKGALFTKTWHSRSRYCLYNGSVKNLGF